MAFSLEMGSTWLPIQITPAPLWFKDTWGPTGEAVNVLLLTVYERNICCNTIDLYSSTVALTRR